MLAAITSYEDDEGRRAMSTGWCDLRFRHSPRLAHRSVKLYRDQYGVPAEKIVPGGAFYARGWKGGRTTDNGLYQWGSGAAPGKYESGAAYGVLWSYDDRESVRLKGETSGSPPRGMMFWEQNGDNANGDLFDSMKQSLTAALLPESDPCTR